MASMKKNVRLVKSLDNYYSTSALVEVGCYDFTDGDSTYAADVRPLYCKKCGTVRYSLCKLKIREYVRGNPRVFWPENYVEESTKGLEKCPVCGSNTRCGLSTNTFSLSSCSRYPACSDQKGVQKQLKDTLKRLLFDVRKEDNETAPKKLAKKIKTWDITPNTTITNVSIIKETPEGLKQYILQLIRLETIIFATTKRLEQLYNEQVQTNRKVIYESFQPSPLEIKKKDIETQLSLVNEEVSTYEEELRIAEKDLSRAQKVLFEVETHPIQIDYPQMPLEPQYEKPSLFNKKRILAENAEKKQRYEQAYRVYQMRLSECEQKRIEYSPEKKREEVTKAEENVKNAKLRLSSSTKKLKKLHNNLEEVCIGLEKSKDDNYIVLSPAKVLDDSYKKEIKVSEKLLKDSYSARNELYSYNIVFAKYRDIVALTTFYEYLMAGRCTSLEGTDGAYNLYESETRANMIISQLSTIISKLEQIKTNQYMLYSELKKVNQNLSTLNENMEQVKESIERVGDNTEAIASSAEMIAYNTEVTAFYAKKNAELTDALGYMVAFK